MEHSQLEGAARSRPLVLVVDDDSGLRESLRVILEDEFEVLDVPDGLQALEVVRSYQVDLVLLDIRMPGMDGITVLERMKALDEQIEVILVTAVMEVRIEQVARERAPHVPPCEPAAWHETVHPHRAVPVLTRRRQHRLDGRAPPTSMSNTAVSFQFFRMLMASGLSTLRVAPTMAPEALV